jgi:antitoxin VapB
MSLNIKDRETHEMVRALAKLNETSLTAAVKEAVREKLERDRADRSAGTPPAKKSRHELFTEFSALTAPLFKGSRTGNELINDLYDEQTGLPK